MHRIQLSRSTAEMQERIISCTKPSTRVHLNIGCCAEKFPIKRQNRFKDGLPQPKFQLSPDPFLNTVTGSMTGDCFDPAPNISGICKITKQKRGTLQDEFILFTRSISSFGGLTSRHANRLRIKHIKPPNQERIISDSIVDAISSQAAL